MDNLFEQEYVDVDDLFNIKGFQRTPIILMRNVINRNSKHDLSSYVVERHPHIVLGYEPNKDILTRLETVMVDKDPKTTVDIISIFVRLYDTDVNTESIINEDILIGINKIIEDNNYKELFIETDLSFNYKWVNELKTKNVKLLGSKY